MSQDFGDGDVALECWRCGEFFSRDASLGGIVPFDWSGMYVLELGAGLGMLSMVLALHGAHMVATDVASVVPTTLRNFKENRLHRCVRAVALDWFDPPPKLILDHVWDVVVATDVVYNPSHFDALIRTLKCVCGKHTRIILVYQERDHTSEFFEMLWKENFTLEKHAHFKDDSVDVFIVSYAGSAHAMGDVVTYYRATRGVG